MSPVSGEITVLLSQLKTGDRQAASQLMEFVYAELRRLAGACIRNERPNHTLQPTALVHEAWMRITAEQNGDWRDRAHFVGLAATAMRRILVEHARKRHAAKRGGKQQQVELGDHADERLNAELIDVIEIHEALDRLAELDPRLSRVVELRFFGGLSVEEAAEVMAVSPKTIKRDWVIAKAWLGNELGR